MKKFFAILLSISLLLALSACAAAETSKASEATDIPSTSEEIITEQVETTVAHTEEETTIETTAAPLIDNPEQLKTLLTNVFSNTAYQTLVTVEDGTATVIILNDEFTSLYSDASNGSQESMKLWDDLTASFLGLHNSARDLMSTLYGNYSLKTILSSSKGFPYLSITDGEITLDFFHIGEE